jgi:hypothetical protein
VVQFRGTEEISCRSRLRKGTDPGPEASWFLVFRIPGDGQSKKTPVILSAMQYCQKPLESAMHRGRACGSVVVKALVYKPEGRGFETLKD